MKNLILTLLVLAITIPTLIAQPAGYDKNFRKIGENHNKLIRYVLDRLTSNPNMREVNQLISDGMAGIYKGANVYDAYEKHPEFKTYVDDYHKAKDKVAYVNRYLSRNARVYFKQIITATNTESHEQLVEQMESIIETVIASELSTDEKNALLYGASVGMSSSALWRGLEGPLMWKNSPEAPALATLSANGGEDILVSDAAGAVGGAAGSATVTWILGPGIVPTSGAAGLFVGSGSSVATGVKKLWNWIVD
ncbi:MAG: hypothetical protein AAF985_07180 [Bacteroidota bacterium]